MSETVEGPSGPVTYEEIENLPAGEMPMEAKRARVFACSAEKANGLLAHLTSWAGGAGYETQQYKLETGETVLQLKCEDVARWVVGMDLCLNVVLTQNGDNLSIATGEGKYASKVSREIIGWLFFFPFIITAGVGLYQQAGIPDAVYEQVDKFLS